MIWLTLLQLRSKNEAKRREAVEKLGQYRGRHAVRALTRTLRDDDSIYVRLMSYAILERTPGHDFDDQHVQSLVESTAIEIRRLYSRTVTVVDRVAIVDYENSGYSTYPTEIWGPVEQHDEPDPDIPSIERLIQSIPTTLRASIRELSGEAKSRFQW